MNTGNTYYFIDDSNNICKQENGVQKEFSEVLELQDLIDEVNNLIDKNEQLKNSGQYWYDEHKRIVNCYLDKIKELENENEQLKEALKNSYLNEICENCKYGHYFLSDNFEGGFEGDFECLKKHFGKDDWKCDGLTECSDFELNIGDVE